TWSGCRRSTIFVAGCLLPVTLGLVSEGSAPCCKRLDCGIHRSAEIHCIISPQNQLRGVIRADSAIQLRPLLLPTIAKISAAVAITVLPFNKPLKTASLCSSAV